MTEATKGYSKRWIALLFLGLSLLIIALDNTVLNVALPSITEDLGASVSQQQWIVNAYVLVFAALLLTMGALGDRIGRKKALQTGLVIFGLCSLLAALSPTTGTLIGARALLGIGAAIIMPATLSILTATFRDPKERAQAIALWAGTFALGVGTGPVLAGYLLEHFAWHSVFLINIPVVIVALIGGRFFMEESKDEKAARPDIPGVIFSITGLFALIYGIIKAGSESWSADIVLASFGAAAVLLTAFALWEWRATEPMLPLRFFRNMSFTGANIALTLVMFSMFGTMFFLSQYFQSVQGYSALETGLRIMPIAPVSFVMAVNSARVARTIGTKLTVGLGILLAGSGMFYLSQVADVDTPYSTILFGMCILAAGMGTAMSPATNSIMGSVPVRKAGVGSAMNDTTRQVGGALGVAVLGTVMNSVYLSKTEVLRGSLSEGVFETVQNSIQTALIVAEQLPPHLAQPVIEASKAGFVSGMNDAFLYASIIMAAASLITLAILPKWVRRPPEEEEEAADDAAVPDMGNEIAISVPPGGPSPGDTPEAP